MRKTASVLIVAVTVLGLIAVTPPAAQAALRAWDAPPINIAESPAELRNAQVVTDGDTITAIWYGFDGTDYRVQTSFSTDAGANWSFPLTISAAGQSATDPQLVTNGTTITAVWSRFEVRGSANVIQSSFSVNGGASWSTPRIISGFGGGAVNPQLVTNGTTVTAVWAAGPLVLAASSIDGGITWSIPATLSTNGTAGSLPQLVIRGATTTAVWVSDIGSRRVQTSSSTDGGVTWSAPTTLSSASGNENRPQLVSDSARVTAIWERNNGSINLIQAASSTNGGTTWSTPVTLSRATANASRPHLVTNGATITAAWVAESVVQAASSTNGGTTWSTPADLFSAGVLDADRPRLVTDGTTITAVWVRSDGFTVYMQTAFSKNGGATWSNPVKLSDDDPSGSPPQLATDGNTVTTVWTLFDNTTFRIQASSYTANPIVSRLSGADRYETAVEISKEFAPGVPVVYLATGTNYPDALSAASAAASRGGPLLLTPPTALPDVVRNELLRLNPTNVVIVGGTGVVSAAVQTQVDALLPGANLSRDSGTDRYATSRVIAEKAFSADVTSTAFIATGTNFPDALSASAAAGVAGAPVILVNGAASGIDSDTANLLDNLGVQTVIIAGGEGVVSVGIENALNSLVSGNVTRLSGSDRYATSVEINTRFLTANTVYLATGLGFADALAGAALAGSVGGPLYVVPGTCVPAPVLAALTRLDAKKVVLLGGPGVLTNNVFNLVRC